LWLRIAGPEDHHFALSKLLLHSAVKFTTADAPYYDPVMFGTPVPPSQQSGVVDETVSPMCEKSVMTAEVVA
jgi:hypothetical protein